MHQVFQEGLILPWSEHLIMVLHQGNVQDSVSPTLFPGVLCHSESNRTGLAWTKCDSAMDNMQITVSHFIFFTSYCLYHFLNLSSLFGFFLSLSQTLLRNILVTLKHNFLGWPLLGMNTTTTALTCCFTIYTSVSGTYYMLGFNWEK